ncbi:hypothetical protein ACFQ60_38515 [Streptomyces zhihengii]
MRQDGVRARQREQTRQALLGEGGASSPNAATPMWASPRSSPPPA